MKSTTNATAVPCSVNISEKSDDFIIADCAPADLSALVSLESECFSNPYTQDMLRATLSNSLSIVLKAILSQEIIAYIVFEKVLDEAELVRIAVKKDFRRIGVGGKLLESAISRLVKAQIKKLFLEVDEINEPALRLYKSFGFDVISMRKKYYGERAAVIMQKICN